MVLVLCLLSLPAAAQSSALPGRLSVAAGVEWMGTMTIASGAATETTPTSGRFPLFSTDTSLGSAAGFKGTVGFLVTRAFEVEGSASLMKPDLQTRVTGDAEGAPDLTVSEPVKQLTVEGSVIVHLTQWRIGSRIVPYVAGGAGFLRQLHDTGTVAENGSIYHVGAGIHYLLTNSATGGIKALGIRLDGRAVMRSGGVSFVDGVHVSPGAGALLFVRF